MSLARAFFQAGATSVIASLWPLRDDETAWLMERFYDHLGHGLTAAAALRATQTDGWRARLPAASWGGLVLFGDGAVRPFVQPQPPVMGRRAILAAAGVFVGLAVAIVVARRWRRARMGSARREAAHPTHMAP